MHRATLIVVAALVPLAAHGFEFQIEDRRLEPMSKGVAAAIYQSVTAKGEASAILKSCTFIGKPVALNGKKKPNAFVVTTANGCAWGAANAPIYVVTSQGSVVLSAGGALVSLTKSKHSGFHDIAIKGGSASDTASTRWVFNGYQYQESKR